MPSKLQGRVAIAVVGWLIASGASAQSLRPFATDQCSLFPDRSPFGGADWCHCCVVHDLAYWRGGDEDARLKADEELKACVRRASGSKLLAGTMFLGTRIGGSPWLPTWFRWGYGWPFGRGYRTLAPDEGAVAASLERQYRATNPALACAPPAGAASSPR